MREELTERQKREIEYHRAHAATNVHRTQKATATDIATSERRRWWNPYWHTYTLVRSRDWRNKRVLVVGCGFGEDVIRMSCLAGEVYGFDISPESLEIANTRCARDARGKVVLDVMAAEQVLYPDDFFDCVYVRDILHHVEIKEAMKEISRVCKDGGVVVGLEMYAHSILEKIRNSKIVEKFFYNKMKEIIYGSNDIYITEDERKLTEVDIEFIRDVINFEIEEYFNMTIGRLLPDRFDFIAKAERRLLRTSTSLGRLLGNRVVFLGTVHKGRDDRSDFPN